ncbi:hypothetical protein ARMGADRAFT_311632 [Armillaria gallica]|uniref:Uncharacterized protein n=1 Tax=Armillaria gallica TaxID=47427 RepID=A0A2H3DHC2_ARMGA|nr:hypothetical protein ARMGADRAFT_311632 [Armillaria gallica]
MQRRESPSKNITSPWLRKSKFGPTIVYVLRSGHRYALSCCAVIQAYFAFVNVSFTTILQGDHLSSFSLTCQEQQEHDVRGTGIRCIHVVDWFVVLVIVQGRRLTTEMN